MPDNIKEASEIFMEDLFEALSKDPLYYFECVGGKGACGGKGGGWKPTMTEKEAEEWAKDSKEQRIFMHGTDHGDVIRKDGFAPGYRGAIVNGIYTTLTSEDASQYGKEILRVKVKLKNPLTAKRSQLTDKLADLEEKFMAENKIEKWSVKAEEGFRKYLINKGYDGIVTNSGDNIWCIVLDKQSITVIK